MSTFTPFQTTTTDSDVYKSVVDVVNKMVSHRSTLTTTGLRAATTKDILSTIETLSNKFKDEDFSPLVDYVKGKTTKTSRFDKDTNDLLASLLSMDVTKDEDDKDEDETTTNE